MRAFLWLVFLPAFAYQTLALFASLRQMFRKPPPPSSEPVSVLKPVRGMDPNTSEAFVSQIEQAHPQFEVLFAARDMDDPVALEVVNLQRGHPNAPIQFITGGPATANAKVGRCVEMTKHARYPLRVLNDSDIKVDPAYLATVIAPLADAEVGVVTCLYRVKAYNVPAGWEALGIMTDFMPSTMVAQLIGVREFGLGSTLAFRAADLEAVGGFEGFADYIADDYQLAKRISGLGKRVVLSTYVVETTLSDATWAGVWQHQVRWARTIRLSKGGGYAGLSITHAGLWALAAALAGAWPIVAGLIAMRVVSAFASGLVLKSGYCQALCWLAPVWDVYSFGIWVASYLGATVRWRDRTLRLGRGGRIVA